MNGDIFKVLLVDDSSDDRFFLRIALKRSQRLAVIGELQDGDESMAYLKGEGKFGNRLQYPLPDIMLIDLKMPGKTGFDVLEWLLTENMRNLTVAVMSGSWLSEDISKSMALGAHAYFKKTSEKEEQLKMVSEIEILLEKRQSKK